MQEAVAAGHARRRGARALLKDPIAFFSAEWMASTYDADIVIPVRHPAAFASSLKRLGWNFDFRNLTSQNDLITGPLSEFAPELHDAARRDVDVIEQAVLLWRVFTHVAMKYQSQHPAWSVVRYEDLAADPMGSFRTLYDRLGLTWSTRVEDGVHRHTTSEDDRTLTPAGKGGVVRDSRAAVWTWRDRLTSSEVRRIREGTADAAHRLYGERDWSLAR